MKIYSNPDLRILGLRLEEGFATSTEGNTLPSVGGDDWTNSEFA